jgi:phosphatidylglycerophosphatase A
MRRIGVFVATAAGAGYFPFAPGTVGSAIGAAIYLLDRHWFANAQLMLIAVTAVVGTWSAHVAEAHFGREDPGQVVIDEVAGQLITLFATGAGVIGTVIGFLIFRVLDIVKPWPARQFERFPGGVGIMADDVMAGIYGNVLLRIILLVFGSLSVR